MSAATRSIGRSRENPRRSKKALKEGALEPSDGMYRGQEIVDDLAVVDRGLGGVVDPHSRSIAR
jgi:hypothetical protein